MPAIVDAAIADALAGPGWIVVDDFIATDLVETLREGLIAAIMVPARVGAGESAQHLPALRGDSTQWFHAISNTPVQTRLCARLEVLRLALNAALFAGIDDVECHYAHYPVGSVYGLHRDRFRDDDRRVISCVLYLNADWPDAAGGGLQLYDDDTLPLVEIAPRGGRAVFFRSECFPHEVLAASRDRYSIAAWFLRRAH